MDEDLIENRKSILLAEHANIMNAGLTDTRMRNLLKKVGELPEKDQTELKRLFEIAEASKRHLEPRSL